MTEKTEVAKLAVEFTIALLQDRNAMASKVLSAARAGGAAKDLPDPLVLFDAIYDHVLTKLTPQ